MDIQGTDSYIWPEALRGVEAKVRRAKAHTDDLKEEVNRFTGSDQHRFPIERNTDGSEYFGRAYFDPIPDPLRWGVIVGEIAHNLRSALNALAWQLVIRAGGRPDSQTEFPIFKDADRFFVEVETKLRGVSDEMLAKIKDAQPFNLSPERVTKHALWLLHDLNKTDKHRLVLPVVTAVREVTPLTYTEGIEIRVAPSAEHGAVITHVIPAQPTLELDMKLQLAYQVSVPIGRAAFEIGQLTYDFGLQVQDAVLNLVEFF